MIAATASKLAPVRGQTAPERRASALLQRMGTDPHHARPLARVGAVLAGFVEEVDAAGGPLHAAAATGERSRAANLFPSSSRSE